MVPRLLCLDSCLARGLTILRQCFLDIGRKEEECTGRHEKHESIHFHDFWNTLFCFVFKLLSQDSYNSPA